MPIVCLLQRQSSMRPVIQRCSGESCVSRCQLLVPRAAQSTAALTALAMQAALRHFMALLKDLQHWMTLPRCWATLPCSACRRVCLCRHRARFPAASNKWFLKLHRHPTRYQKAYRRLRRDPRVCPLHPGPVMAWHWACQKGFRHRRLGPTQRLPHLQTPKMHLLKEVRLMLCLQSLVNFRRGSRRHPQPQNCPLPAHRRRRWPGRSSALFQSQCLRPGH